MALTYSSFSFFFGVGIVETQAAQAVVNISQNRSSGRWIWRGRCAGSRSARAGNGFDGCMLTAFEVFFDDGADKVVVRELVFIQHNISLMER